MASLFVTATGTEIGKTFVSAGIISALRRQGRAVLVRKPVATGFDENSLAGSDPAILAEACGLPADLTTIATISPWRFAAPLSPDMAAAREGRAIDFDALTRFCVEAMAKTDDVLLIEGIGGLMVPFNAEATVCDLVTALESPLLLVAGTYLGSLSHTLCVLEVARSHDLKVAAVVLNESPGSPVSLDATRESLANFWDGPVFGLTRIASLHAAVFDQLAEILPPRRSPVA